jgi:hypothetical protein
MGEYLRRMKSKMDAPAATTATAHKIAIIFYTMVKTKWNTIFRFGRSAMPSARNASKRNSNGRLSDWVTNWSQSKKNLPRNRLSQKVRGGSSSKVRSIIPG